MAQAFARSTRARAWLDGTAGAVYLDTGGADRVPERRTGRETKHERPRLRRRSANLAKLLSRRSGECEARAGPAHDEMLSSSSTSLRALVQQIIELDLSRDFRRKAMVVDDAFGPRVHAAERYRTNRAALPGFAADRYLERDPPIGLFVEVIRNLLMPGVRGFRASPPVVRLSKWGWGSSAQKKDAVHSTATVLTLDGRPGTRACGSRRRAAVIARSGRRPGARTRSSTWWQLSAFARATGTVNTMLAQDMEHDRASRASFGGP